LVGNDLCTLPTDRTNDNCYAYNNECHSSCPANTESSTDNKICSEISCEERVSVDEWLCSLPADGANCYAFVSGCFSKCPTNTFIGDDAKECESFSCVNRQVDGNKFCMLDSDEFGVNCYEYNNGCYVDCPPNTRLDEQNQLKCVDDSDGKSRSSSVFPWWIFLIIGIIIIIIIILILLIIVYKRKKKKRMNEDEDLESSSKDSLENDVNSVDAVGSSDVPLPTVSGIDTVPEQDIFDSKNIGEFFDVLLEEKFVIELYFSFFCFVYFFTSFFFFYKNGRKCYVTGHFSFSCIFD
jgi:hypothetical protein